MLSFADLISSIICKASFSIINDIDNLFHVCLLQEVTLPRKCLSEKVGLTLCYGSAEDDITDIFISEVSLNYTTHTVCDQAWCGELYT